MKCLLLNFWLLSSIIYHIAAGEETYNWEDDLTNEITIGITKDGFKSAVLECSDDWMAFVVTLEEGFDGVLYTRGSFYKRQSPCFRDAQGEKDFALKFAYNECGGKHDSSEGGYINTVILQHENDLIMPGDLAFKLICKDEKTVTASLDGIKTQIRLVDPDPAGKSNVGGSLSAMSSSNIVTLKPASQKKEEL